MTSFQYKITIKELPTGERPRERLQKYGPSALSNAELVAIQLGGGFQNFSALNLAQHLLQEYESLIGLSKVDLEQLCKTKGIGLAKACQLLAAFELGKRIASNNEANKPEVDSPEAAANLILPRYGNRTKECVGILALDTKNRVIKEFIVSVGILDSSIVHPREVFRPAIVSNAAAVILFHNHPSGDPTPSNKDIDITNRLAEVGKLMGLDLLDHIIVAHNKFISLKKQGMIN